MDTSDLQDDLDKLSQILDGPDPEDLKCDDHSLDSQCESSEESDKQHSLLPTSSLKCASQESSKLSPVSQQEKHDCNRLLNKHTPLMEPGDKQSSINSADLVLSSIEQDQNDEISLHVSDDSIDLEANCDQSSHIYPTTGVDLAEPPGKPPPLVVDSYALEIPSQTQQNGIPQPPTCNEITTTPSVEPGDEQDNVKSSPVLTSIDNDWNNELSIHLSDNSMELEDNGGESSHISSTAGVDLPELPGKPPSPPALDNHALEIPSKTQQTGMRPPPAPEDALHGFDGFIQESCAPDFDIPDAVVDTTSGAENAVEVLVPERSVQDVRNGVEDMASLTGDWLRERRSAELSSDIGRLTQILDAPGLGRDADRDVGEELLPRWGEEDSDPAAPSDPTESSAVQGDINKLSQALATASVAPPMQLGPLSRPMAVPSPARGRGSGQASVASTSGAQLPSAFGDELLSQDDFLDDTFIGQEVPVNLENCLALNAAYQEVVDENLTDLEQLLRRNRARQAELTTLLSTKQDSGRPQRAIQTRCSRWNWSMFMFQYFTDADGFGPMPNADTRTKTALCEYEDLRWSRPWLQSEREKLFETILVEARWRHERVANHRVAAVRNALRQLEATKPRPEGREAAEAALTSLQSKLEEAERLLAEAKAESVLDIIAELDDEYDWQKIAHTSLDGLRSATECRLQWCNFVRPTISHAEWTPEEDERVRAAAADAKSDNRWQAAADQLGRTAFQVFQRWKAVLTTAKRTFWTDEESERLLKAVSAVRIGNYINWGLVAVRLPGRTVTQCNIRYRKLISQQRRGRFSVQEDMRLIAAVEEAGIKDFRAISAYIPGRSEGQLYNRYNRYLSSTLPRSEWTREEDEQLVRFVSEHGPLWSKAAAQIGNGRIGDQCYNRFRRIETAFQSCGGVPATGSLGGKSKRSPSEYHSNLREQLQRRLVRLKPDGEKDPADARKQAALALLKRKMPEQKTVRKREISRVQKALVRKSKQMRELQWSSSSVVLLAEARPAHRRRAAPDREAAAAAVTARAWCLPPPSPERLEACASAGPPNNEFAAGALSEWRAALGPDAPESPLRRAVSAVGRREYNWRRMPLLPPSFASCSVFRSLILQQPRFEHHAAEVGGPATTRRLKMKAFNRDVAAWAGDAMSGGGDGGAEGATPWLVPTDRTRHQDRMVRVRITEKPPGDRPPRQFHLTVDAAEANDPQQLAKRILRQVPHMVKMDITKAPAVRDGLRPAPPPGPPPAASAADAWHLLVARFSSMLFWPALLSMQPPPDASDLTRLEADDEELVDCAFGGLIVVNSDDDEDAGQLQKRTYKRAPVPNQSGRQPKRRKR